MSVTPLSTPETKAASQPQQGTQYVFFFGAGKAEGNGKMKDELVGKGAVFENVDRDGAVDLLKFPVPFLHELDGGRFIGTDDIVIMRDPEDNWVNCATYRAMVQDKNHVSIWISPGKHGRQIREKYFKAGKPCPVLISCGHDPLLFLAGGNELKFGLSEYDYAGGHRGLPYEVIESAVYGLPMPAHA